MIFRLGELFSGPGGLALGAKTAGFNHNNEFFGIEHIWANDYDKDSCDTYRLNILSDHPNNVIENDIRKLDPKNLEKIDAFTYGFPCNDFSIVGEQQGFNGNYGPLYKYGVEVINYHNPLWFLAENVSGLQNANEGNAFNKIISDLSHSGNFGYELTIHKYKFEEYGIPQKRHRIIIIGIRSDLNLKFKVPAPTTPNADQQMTAKEALENPPIPKTAPNNELTKHPKMTIERLKAIPPGKNVWWEGLPEHLRLNVKGAKLSQIYRRLHPDQPSYTITGSGGGGTHGYHWTEPRALTNRERARLQTFPDDFIFMGSKESVRKQIGMAVPPEGAKLIINSILKTFANIYYPSINPNF